MKRLHISTHSIPKVTWASLRIKRQPLQDIHLNSPPPFANVAGRATSGIEKISYEYHITIIFYGFIYALPQWFFQTPSTGRTTPHSLGIPPRLAFAASTALCTCAAKRSDMTDTRREGPGRLRRTRGFLESLRKGTYLVIFCPRYSRQPECHKQTKCNLNNVCFPLFLNLFHLAKSCQMNFVCSSLPTSSTPLRPKYERLDSGASGRERLLSALGPRGAVANRFSGPPAAC